MKGELSDSEAYVVVGLGWLLTTKPKLLAFGISFSLLSLSACINVVVAAVMVVVVVVVVDVLVAGVVVVTVKADVEDVMVGDAETEACRDDDDGGGGIVSASCSSYAVERSSCMMSVSVVEGVGDVRMMLKGRMEGVEMLDGGVLRRREEIGGSWDVVVADIDDDDDDEGTGAAEYVCGGGRGSVWCLHSSSMSLLKDFKFVMRAPMQRSKREEEGEGRHATCEGGGGRSGLVVTGVIVALVIA
jgi:hypothetical protein